MMSTCKKVYTLFFVLIALALALIVSIWPVQRMHEIIFITRFFEAMLPVLAVGALIKYLCCGGGKSGYCDSKTTDKNAGHGKTKTK